MDDAERQEKQRQARHRLSAQRARAGFLRGRIVAASLLCFAVLWAVVCVQMATGNDPVLSAKAPASGSTAAGRRHRPGAGRSPREAVETTEPRELEEPIESGVEESEVEASPPPEAAETEALEAEAIEAEAAEAEALEAERLEAEAIEAEARAAETELEPLTTGQS